MSLAKHDFNDGSFFVGDCFEAMAAMPDASVDLVFTDPPYRTISGGTKSSLAAGWSTSVLSKNDGKIFANNDVSISQYMAEFFRLLKDGSHCYVMTNNLNLRELLNVAATVGFGFHNLLAWRKNTCTANRWYMKEMELVCFFYKKPAMRINNASSKQIFEFPNPRAKVHPTEKPWQLAAHYIENSSHPGDLVLDPFAGSGATAIAATNLGRRWVCAELDSGFAEDAICRVVFHDRDPSATQAISPRRPCSS